MRLTDVTTYSPAPRLDIPYLVLWLNKVAGHMGFRQLFVLIEGYPGGEVARQWVLEDGHTRNR